MVTFVRFADTDKVMPRGLLRAPAAVVGAAVVVALSGGVVAALVLPATSNSATVLRHPVNVTVTDAAGVKSAGRNGEVLASGVTVTAAPGGSAELTTGSRQLWLGTTATKGTTVHLSGAAAADIRSGSVVAINESGRTWSLAAGPVTATRVKGTLRIDRADVVRFASFSGKTQLAASTGGSLTLAGLQDINPAGATLPAKASPLLLRDDALDRIASSDLVDLDLGLLALAGQIDADPYLAAVYDTAERDAGNPSEHVLAAAIGLAGTGGPLAKREQAASSLRSDGGSWGVVSRSLEAGLPGVRSSLSTLLNAVAGRPTSTLASVTTPTAASPSPSTVASNAPATVSDGARPTGAAKSASSSEPKTASVPVASVPAVALPVAPPTVPAVVASALVAPPSGVPSPTPSPELINTLLKTVGSLVPTPQPSQGSAGGPAATPTASPSPSARSGLTGTVDTVVGVVTGH